MKERKADTYFKNKETNKSNENGGIKKKKRKKKKRRIMVRSKGMRKEQQQQQQQQRNKDRQATEQISDNRERWKGFQKAAYLNVWFCRRSDWTVHPIPLPIHADDSGTKDGDKRWRHS